MSKSGPRTDRPERILAALEKAGTMGLPQRELAIAIGINGTGTASMLVTLKRMMGENLVFLERAGPALLYFHGQVDRDAAASRFAVWRVQALKARAEKAEKTRGGKSTFSAAARAAGLAARWPKLGTAPRRRELPAVDPQGLRSDATVTGMDTAPRTVAKAPRGRYEVDQATLSGLSKLPLGVYSEPASSWASVVTDRSAA